MNLYIQEMSIVTKTGDGGTTGLWSGERISKDDLRVECYGTIDELSSALGVARHSCKCAVVLESILSLQKDLYRVATELASPSRIPASPVTEADEQRLVTTIHTLESELKLVGFVVPGMTSGSAALDVARTIARRAERRIVSLASRENVGMELRRFVNRTSDFLFVLARKEEFEQNMITYVKS